MPAPLDSSSPAFQPTYEALRGETGSSTLAEFAKGLFASAAYLGKNVAVGLGFAGRNAAGFGFPGGLAGLSGGSGLDGQAQALNDLFERQVAIQMQMQVFTMQTNIAKAQHDTRMEAIRNMKP